MRLIRKWWATLTKMPAAIPNTQDCCSQCPEIPITQVPGPAGNNGTNGTNGATGVNAFTLTTSTFVMPAVGGTVSVPVVESRWTEVGQVDYVQGAGYFSVNLVPNSTHISLKNLGYTGNAAPTTVIASGSKVMPGGIKGTDGAAGAGQTLNSVSPTTTKGDLIADNGANNPLASDVRLASGTDGTTLHSDSSQPTGLKWAKVNLASASEVTGVLPSGNGGNSDRVAKAGDTMTGQLIHSFNSPQDEFKNNSAGADEKRWLLGCVGNSPSTFALYTLNDAGNASVQAFEVSRSSTSPVSFVVNAALITNSALSVQSFIQIIQSTNTALINGDNNNVNLGSGSHIKIKTGPSAGFALTGISAGLNGWYRVLINGTGQVMTLKHENASSIASNRISSPTGADLVCNRAIIIYDIDANRHTVIAYS